MEFEIYTQDGFHSRGIKEFNTLKELVDFIKLNEPHEVSITTDAIYVMNIGKEDLF